MRKFAVSCLLLALLALLTAILFDGRLAAPGAAPEPSGKGSGAAQTSDETGVSKEPFIPIAAPPPPAFALPPEWAESEVFDTAVVEGKAVFHVRREDLPYPVRLERSGETGKTVFAAVADRLLVRLPVGTPAGDLAQIRNIRGSEPRGSRGWHLVYLEDDGINERRQTVEDLKRTIPGILIEADAIVHHCAVPDDPAFSDGLLWNLDNRGQNGGLPGVDIEASEGWELSRSSQDLTIAVLDSGVRLSHEDIKANLWTNVGEVPGNGLDDDNNGWVDDIHGVNALDGTGNPMDDNGHGSHVAGTIAASGGNAIGSTGVAWEARIMPLKFLGAYGSGSISDAIEAIDYARSQGVRLINNSWGSTFRSQALGDYMDELEDAGVIMVVAAGNNGSNVEASKSYPAHYPNGNIISVAAHDRRGERADFSNYSQGWVQLSAPGVDVYSLDDLNDQAYSLKSGTSMAAPHVSAVLAMVASRFPHETPENWMSRVITGTRTLDSLDDAVADNRSLSLWGALADSASSPSYDEPETPLVLRDSFAYARIQTGATTRTAGEGDWPSGVERVIWLQWQTGVSGTSIIDTLESSADTVLRVFESVDGLPVLVAENDDILGGLQSRVTFEANADTPYLIAIGSPRESFGSVIVNAAGPPENDMLADATVFAPYETGTVGSSRNGSREPGEPEHAGFAGGASVWLKWTPPISGLWSATTRNSDYDTLLAVYRGPAEAASFDDLTLVAENDDIGPGLRESAVKFNSIAGETLYFAIDDKDGLGGKYALAWRQPPRNDDFADRPALFGENLQRNGTTTHATREPGEPNHHPQAGGNSVWWEWTPPAEAHYRITAKGAFAGTTLALYTGSSLEELEKVDSDYNSGDRASSEIIVGTTAGKTYNIAVDSAQSLTGDFTLTIEGIVIPANDDFGNARELSASLPTSVEGSNAGASYQPGEPGNGDYGRVNTVWYRWVPEISGQVLVSTEGSAFNTFLAVFSGTTLADLNELAASSFDTADKNSELSLAVRAGSPLYLQISGANNQTGAFKLAITELEVPENDHFEDARIVQLDPEEADTWAYSFSNTGATRQTGEPFHGFDENSETPVPGNASLWWKYTPVAETAGRTTASTISPGTTTMSVAVYTGSSLNNLTQVAQASRFQVFGSGQVTWEAEPGTTYYIAVAGNNDTGQGRLTIQGKTPQDTLSGSYPLLGDTVTARAWNINATREPGEPEHAGDLGGRSIWYSWTPTESGTYRISTAGSHTLYSDSQPMDTILAVYTGPSLAGLVTRASNDDRHNQDGTSEVIIDALAGTTYAIAVDGWNPSFGEAEDPAFATQGRIHLSITPADPPPNDDFEAALAVADLPVNTFTNVAAATLQNGEPVHDGKRARSVWYKWTAPRDGIVAAGTTGNLYDDFRARESGIGVYTGSAPASLQRAEYLPGYPESAGLGARTVLFHARAGTTYYFATDDTGSASASNLAFYLDWAPENDDFAGAVPIEGTSAVMKGHNMGATAEPGGPVIPDPSYHNPEQRPSPTSVWWKWTAPAAGNTRLDTLGSEIYSVLAVYTGNSVDSLTAVAYENSVGRDPVNGNNRARTGTGFLDFEAAPGTTYYIQVVGDLYDRSSQGPIVLSLEGPPLPPEPPTGLIARATGPDRVELSWEAGSAAEYHRVEWLQLNEDAPLWTGIGNYVSGEAAIVTQLQPASRYLFRVRSENITGVSEWVISEPTETLVHGLAAWRLLHFGSTEPIGEAALSEDPDRDGLPNGVEFWLGMPPLKSGPFPGFPVTREGGEWTCTLPPVPEPLAMRVEFSHDLGTWQTAPAETIQGNPSAREWQLLLSPETVFWRVVILEKSFAEP